MEGAGCLPVLMGTGHFHEPLPGWAQGWEFQWGPLGSIQNVTHRLQEPLTSQSVPSCRRGSPVPESQAQLWQDVCWAQWQGCWKGSRPGAPHPVQAVETLPLAASV